MATALEEYLDDSNKQYTKENIPVQSAVTNNVTAATNPADTNNTFQQQQQPKELIDFFASLENEKVNIFYNPAIQQPQQPQQQFPMFTAPMVTAQPTGHNPFRANTMDSAAVQQLSTLVQTSQPSALVAQPSNSTVLPTNSVSNPFRSNTMPQVSFSSPMQYSSSSSSNWVMQPSISTSHNPFSSTSPPPLNNQSTKLNNPVLMNTSSNNPFTMTGQQQQQWGSGKIF